MLGKSTLIFLRSSKCVSNMIDEEPFAWGVDFKSFLENFGGLLL